jgi:tetratricopeptide (TPR) repeat protein
VLAGVSELFHACNVARYAPVKSSHELAAFIPSVENAIQQLQECKTAPGHSRILPLLVVALLCAPAVFGRDLSSEFDSANKLYGQGKFREAASAYETMVASGKASSALYYNLGNAFFKAGEVGRAVAAYLQAERMAPRDPDLRANLQFIRGQVMGPKTQPSGWRLWFQKLTLNEWTLLGSAALWLSLTSLTLGQLRPGWKAVLRGFTLSSGAAAILLFGCITAAYAGATSEKAVVIAKDATVRNGPLDEAQSVAMVHDGAELPLLDHKNGWVQVAVDGGRKGWLRNEQVLFWPAGNY